MFKPFITLIFIFVLALNYLYSYNSNMKLVFLDLSFSSNFINMWHNMLTFLYKIHNHTKSNCVEFPPFAWHIIQSNVPYIEWQNWPVGRRYWEGWLDDLLIYLASLVGRSDTYNKQKNKLTQNTWNTNIHYSIPQDAIQSFKIIHDETLNFSL